MKSALDEFLGGIYFTCLCCSISYGFSEFHELEHVFNSDP